MTPSAPERAQDAGFRQRFLRESELAASLDHPNVIPIYEAGEADGHLYLAMRFVEGSDLDELLEQGRLAPERAIAILVQVAGALDAAHERGLVHRDVKPGNVLLAGDHVYLSDFGLTKDVAADGPPESGELLGTIDYVAPEQIEEGEVDGRADVYALACVLVRCLTGEVAFPRTRRIAVLFAHLQDPPPRVHERVPELPAALDEVVARGLAKEPADRYASCRELVADAAAELGLPGDASGQASITVGRRRRRWTLAAIATALAAAGALAAGLLLALDRPATAPSVEAREQAERPLTRLEPNSIGLIDATSGRILAQVELPSRPGDLAADGEDVGVTAPDASRVFRIARNGRSVVDTVPVGLDPTAVAIGEGAVWVTQSDGPSLVRISPETGTIVQTIPVGSGPADVAVGHGAVWVANRLDDTVQRVDPSTGKVTSTITVGDEPAGIAISDDAVWIACFASGEVYRVDPIANEVTAIVAAGRGVGSLAVARSGVWAASALDGTVSLIEPSGAALSRTIDVPDGPVALASDGASVWVAHETGTVTQIDTVRGAVTKTVRLGGAPFGLELEQGSLWVSVRGTATSHRGGTLRLVADPGSMPQSVDPRTTNDFWAEQIMSVTNDGLVEFKRVGGLEGATLVPNLARRIPKPTDRGTTYTFRMRPGIRYSTGEFVKASDIRRTLEQSLASGSEYARFLFFSIRGAEACTNSECDLSEGVIADDDAGTIEFRLTAANPDFVYNLARAGAYALPAGTPAAGTADGPFPATGPYMVEEYVEGVRVTLVRNPRFRVWSQEAQPDGYADRIEVRPGQNRGAAIADVADGRADLLLATGVPRERLDELATAKPAQVHLVTFPTTWYLSLNTRVPPFDDVRVRRALNYALDRAAIVDAFGGPRYARPTCQVLPPNYPSYQPYCPYTTNPGPGGQWEGPDLAKAKALVRASGTAGTKIRVWVAAQFPHEIPASRQIVSTLRALGYSASLRVEREKFWELISDPATGAQVALSGWFPLNPTPADFLTSLSCAADNPSGFCDPDIDAMMEQATRLQLSEPTRARELWTNVDRAIVNQAPYAPLVTGTYFELTSERVGNYQFHMLWGALLEQLWVR